MDYIVIEKGRFSELTEDRLKGIYARLEEAAYELYHLERFTKELAGEQLYPPRVKSIILQPTTINIKSLNELATKFDQLHNDVYDLGLTIRSVNNKIAEHLKNKL